MNRTICILLLTIIVGGASYSGVENNGRGAKAVGLANAFVAMANAPWALYYNPAGLSSLRFIELSTFIVPQQFGMNELRTVSLAGSVPTSLGTVGVGVTQFGFALYRETQVSLGVGKTIDWGVSAGIAAHLTRIAIDQYGATQVATVDVGLLAQVHDQVALGFSYKNLLGTSLSSSERLPQVFSLGASYRPVLLTRVVLEFEKDIRYPLIIKAGVEQVFLDILTFRAGVSNNPDKFSAGIGIQYIPFEFVYAGYSHPQLGWTHQLELTFRLSS